MLSLKLVDLSGLDNMRRTTLETQIHQVVGVSSESGLGYMSKEVVDTEGERRRAKENRALAKALAVERDRQVRINSVARDFEVGLPHSIQQPDGEEFPRKCHMQLKSYDQHAEIVKGFIQGPPNKTICNSSDWGSSGSGLEVKGRSSSTSKSNSCSCLLPGQQNQQHLLNFLKPSSSTSISSAGSSSGGKSSPPHSRSPKCHVHSRVSSSSSKSSPKSTKESPSSSTHSSLSALPTHKPTFTEKLQNMFSDRTVSSSSHTNNNQATTSSSGGFARLLSDETKMKPKSSKVKGQSTTTLGKIKGDLKKLSNLPPTVTQVFAATTVRIPPPSDSGKSKNGAERPVPVLDPDDRLRHGDESSDRNGNERERAYSDTMVRTTRSSLPDTSDLSQSRMSLCCEGDDLTSEWRDEVKPGGDVPIDPHQSPSTTSWHGQGQSEQDPTSFLYQHIYQTHPSTTSTPTDPPLNFDTC